MPARDFESRKQEFLDFYAAQLPTLKAAAASFNALIHAILSNLEGVNIAKFECRVKTADECVRKFKRKYRNFVEDQSEDYAIEDYITDLIGVMDDSIDQMHQTAMTIDLYGVTAFAPDMRAMADLAAEAARVTAEAIPLLRKLDSNAPRLHQLTERLVALEGEVDKHHAQGLRALFKECGDNQTMRFIVDREIYSHLEKIADRFEDIANEIQGLVIDHA